MIIEDIVDKLYEVTTKQILVWERTDRSFFKCKWEADNGEIIKNFSIELHRQISDGVEYMVLDILELSTNHRGGFGTNMQTPKRKFSTGLIPNSHPLRSKTEKLYDTIWDLQIFRDLAQSDLEENWLSHAMDSMNIKMDKSDKIKLEQYKTKHKEDGKN